ncbi:MAG TPA: hypothetical protein VK447_14680 [Myxococcaceae bacterium]|nr:hypothetical protein [Myxococcaceae bacterium]
MTACAAPRGVRLDTGAGTPLEHRPIAARKPLTVSAEAFEDALTRLMLNAPLVLRPTRHDLFLRASYASDGADARSPHFIGKSFGGICEPGPRRVDCLSLLDDVRALDEWDKLGVSLGLSLDPLRESISKAVEDTLAPQLFFTLIATGLVTWAVLAANPEPVFTKAAAVISALMLIYLGVETFLGLVDAGRELKRATDKATTAGELEQAAQRFGRRVGPAVARVFVLAVTVAVSYGMTGGAAWLASRVSMLPSFSEAAAVGASELGINLAGVGQVSAVAVVGGSVVVSLPATAVAMAAKGPREGQTSTATGQLHHIISKPIARALAEHRALKGLYTERDPRFVTRAADKASHNGYQEWHRDVDRKVIRWLRTYKDATPEQFEGFLRWLYNQPDLRARFPDGF